jgi:signal transduction histidine kinase
MTVDPTKDLLERIDDLEARLNESEQLIEAIKAGEVDAFAVNVDHQPEIYTIQSGDYAYRVLIEEFGEGALNVTEAGLIVYSNSYFSELTSQPYEKVVSTFIKDFIHNDDVERFDTLFEEAKKGRSKGEVCLKINEKIIPVYISLASLQPKLATVGIIITDLSHKKQQEEVILSYQKDLENKNLELTQSNAELASFNYIASHDLQEPLRKIQMFSNLILNKDGQILSANTKDYFSRIMSAATRMQNLLLALLNYSRANNSEALFSPTDLNSVVEDVKRDLTELLEAHKAEIDTSPLPTLNIIPNQFHQFFTNMITNTIKYKRIGVNPVIKISANVVAGPQIKMDTVNMKKNYWAISIADNGIGFEQQYAEKIFELFQRLYTKQEYEGTGVGLAICKKIIQNHQGFIRATGEPGVGSTFTIYLPINN